MALHVDFETRSACDLKEAGHFIYAEHPTTDVWCMGYAFGDEPVELWKMGEPLPERVRAHVAGGGEVIAHNAAFEHAIWNSVMHARYGWPKLALNQLRCTAVRAYAMALPGSLEKAAPAAGIAHGKDMAGARVMMQLAQPRDLSEAGPVWWTPEEHPDKFEKLYAYCRQDVVVERELTKRLMALSPFEEDVWRLDQTINARGIYIDLKAVRAALKIVDLEKARLDEEMRQVTGNEVATCTASAALSAWLKRQGVDSDGVPKSVVTKLLEDPSLPDQCRRALELRQEAAKSSTAKLKPMAAYMEEGSSSIRGILQYHGASTGRWAGRRLQPQNFPRPSLEQDEIDRVFQILRSVE